jgi:hypothetical protein
MGACFSEAVVVGAKAVVDEATNDVEGGIVAVEDEKAMESSACPAKGGAFACAQEPSFVRDPLAGEGGEGLAEPVGRVSEACATQVGSLLSLGGRVGALLIDAVLSVTVGPVPVEGVTDDRAEVARQGTEVISVQLRAKFGLGLLERLQRVVTIGVDELRDGKVEVIDLVQVSEQQTLAVLFSTCVFASAKGGANQCILIEPGALLGSRASGTGACLVGPKEGCDEQVTESLGKFDIAQLRNNFGDPVGQSEQWKADGLEGTEAPFHCALAERVAFTLGSVLDSELDQSIAGQLGHVRRSLIGDGLQTFTTGDGRGQYADDVFGVFVVIDDNRVEEILIASTDVLCGHQLEWHPKHRQVGGISADLSVGNHEVEAKAWTSQSLGTSLA